MSTHSSCYAHAPLNFAERAFVIGHVTVDAIVCCLILTVNTFIIFALLHQRWCRKETLCPRFKVSSLFVLSLTVADLFIGCTILFYLLTHYICPLADFLMRHKMFCLTKMVGMVFAGTISVTSLAAISLDRYVAVVFALRYQEYMTRSRASAIICGTWIFAGTGAVVLFFWNTFEIGQPCLENVVPVQHMLLISLPMHVIVFLIIVVTHLCIRREINKMRQMRKSAQSSIFGGQNPARNTVTLVIGCYFVCWVPFTCVLLLRLLGVRSSGLDIAFECLFTLANMNAVLNPFIYSYRNASVRTALVQFKDKLVRMAKGKDAVSEEKKKKMMMMNNNKISQESISGTTASTISKSMDGSSSEKYVPIENVI